MGARVRQGCGGVQESGRRSSIFERRSCTRQRRGTKAGTHRDSIHTAGVGRGRPRSALNLLPPSSLLLQASYLYVVRPTEPGSGSDPTSFLCGDAYLPTPFPSLSPEPRASLGAEADRSGAVAAPSQQLTTAQSNLSLHQPHRPSRLNPPSSAILFILKHSQIRQNLLQFFTRVPTDMPEIFEFDLTKLAGGFETRNAGVFEVICSKKEKSFEPFVPAKATAAAKNEDDEDDEDDDEDDEDDLFGDDDDDDDEDEDEDPTERLERLAAKGDKVAIAKLKVVRAKAAKAAKKEAAGRTMIVLEIKPFDDQTNLKELEKEIRQIGPDTLKGLCLWGAEGE